MSGSPPDQGPRHLTVDGRRIGALPGQSVATALCAAGVDTFGRSVKYHRPRGPFCFAGQCGSCLVRIDGAPSVRSCLVEAAAGMIVERQNGFPSVDQDLLSAADLIFAGGMDHHTIGTATRAGSYVINEAVRLASGLGRLPDVATARAPQMLAAPETVRTDVVIVGGGPAGLAAATTLARGGLAVLLIEERRTLGGSLLASTEGVQRRDWLVAQLQSTTARVLTEATAIGWFGEDRAEPQDAPGLLAVATRERLLKIVARRYLYATGSYEQNLLFANNDRPGVVAWRGLLRLVHEEQFRPEGTLLVVGEYGHAAAAALTAAGLAVDRLPVDAELIAARGRTRVTGVDYRAGQGAPKQTRRGRWLVIAARPAPATELLRQHGCIVGWDDARGGLFVVADGEGRTDRPHVFACGDVCGLQSHELSLVAGRRSAMAIAASLARPVGSHE